MSHSATATSGFLTSPYRITYRCETGLMSDLRDRMKVTSRRQALVGVWVIFLMNTKTKKRMSTLFSQIL
jgi:hypothetical protein